MASIEAMTKEAARSLTIRVRRLSAADAELEAAQDMDRRAVARLAAAEKAQDALKTEVTEKADLVSRLTGKPSDEVLAEIRKELFPEVQDDENAETDPAASGDAPADENPDAGQSESADVKPAPKAKATAKKAASAPVPA